jgi:hypothetical protein
MWDLKKRILIAAMFVGALILSGSELALADHGTIDVTLSATPSSGKAPLLVTHNVTVSPASDPECAQEMVSVDFGNGNSVAVFIAGNHVFNAVYTEPGIYTAVLTYTMASNHGDARRPDCQTATATTDARIQVEGLDPLIVTIEADPAIGIAGEVVTFGLVVSTDISCITQFLAISWDFGDGTKGGNMPIEHIYESPGSYLVSIPYADGCDRVVTAELIYTVQGNKAPAPGDGTSNSEKLNILELDISISVESSCELPVNSEGFLPASCFAYTIASTNAENDFGQLRIEQSEGNMAMEFSTPSRDEFLQFNICAIRPNPTTCPPDDYCPETSADDSCDSTASVGITVLYGDFTGVQEFRSTADRPTQLFAHNIQVAQYLDERGATIISVLERFSLLGEQLGENSEILAEIREFLGNQNPLPDFDSNFNDFFVIANETCDEASLVGGTLEIIACSAAISFEFWLSDVSEGSI